jgi:probable phosphoglycerate mutase
MKLIFIRHGDPDYTNDTLTEKGRQEAEILAGDIERFGIDDAYVSPLGRAAATAKYSLDKLGLSGTTLDWLKEFPALVDPNAAEQVRQAYRTELRTGLCGRYEKRIIWDVLPSYYGSHPELFDYNLWKESELVKNSNAAEQYDHVVSSFNRLLSEYGYEKNGSTFTVKGGSDKTVVFFCHFGITSVLLSSLWNISPFVILQFLAMAPTSVTVLATEEREKGIAIFRGLQIGDISHLNAASVEPSFSARFCERFENTDERH